VIAAETDGGAIFCARTQCEFGVLIMLSAPLHLRIASRSQSATEVGGRLDAVGLEAVNAPTESPVLGISTDGEGVDKGGRFARERRFFVGEAAGFVCIARAPGSEGSAADTELRGAEARVGMESSTVRPMVKVSSIIDDRSRLMSAGRSSEAGTVRDSVEDGRTSWAKGLI
jgi:hypothetical protein